MTGSIRAEAIEKPPGEESRPRPPGLTGLTWSGWAEYYRVTPKGRSSPLLGAHQTHAETPPPQAAFGTSMTGSTQAEAIEKPPLEDGRGEMVDKPVMTVKHAMAVTHATRAQDEGNGIYHLVALCHFVAKEVVAICDHKMVPRLPRPWVRACRPSSSTASRRTGKRVARSPGRSRSRTRMGT